MRRLAFLAILPFLIAGLGAACPAAAQEEPPARVGRVSFIQGELAFHTAGETQWSQAAVNYPVATGGAFWTDPKARAEIRVGAQTISLSGNTEIDITRLDQQVMQIALPLGRIELHLRDLPQGNIAEINLPRGGVWLLEPGIYDIDAGTQDQPSRVAVFEGSAHFVGGPVDLAIKAGDAAVISGWETLTASLERAAPDEFAEWCRSRDYHEHKLAAPYYVSPAMTGYEELDQYGSWQDVADYGEVWVPSAVPADWVPYRDGHWVWIAPWGWSWVDDEPWGFAPFHYGRWAFLSGHWCWIPGRFEPQPVYAPALVAFLGDPLGGIAVAGAAGPAVGWFPLGPGEVYWPSYSRDPRYIRNLNAANVSDARLAALATGAARRGPRGGPPPQVAGQNFANRAAATVVPVAAFAGAAGIAHAALHVPPPSLQQARVSLRPPQLAPAAARLGQPPTAGAATSAMRPGPLSPNRPGAGGAVPDLHRQAGMSMAPGAHLPAAASPRLPVSAHAPPPTALTPPPTPGGHAARAAHAPMPAALAPPTAAHAGAPVHVPAPPSQVMHAPPHIAAPHIEHSAAPPPAAMHPPPPVMHAAPRIEHGATPPPQVVHAPPPQAMHPPPAMAQPAPPPQVMHAAPPPQVMRGAPAPIAQPSPPPQVMHAAPPPPVMRAAPQPVHAPPPQMPHPAAAAQQPHPPAPATGPHPGGAPGQEKKE